MAIRASSPSTQLATRQYRRTTAVALVWLGVGAASCFQESTPDQAPPTTEPLGVVASPMMVDGEYKIETNTAGSAYRDLCKSMDVPVPDRVVDLGAGWGVFDSARVSNPFILGPLQPEVWFLKESDGGVCVALPRMVGDSHVAQSFNMICMAKSGETCFFSHQYEHGDDEEKDAPDIPGSNGLPIEQFEGGVDLVGRSAGACTDCHIGENPFIIHPSDPAMISLGSLRPSSWPVPIVPSAFPGNPPPIEQLVPLANSGGGDCNQCHVHFGPGGRLPLVSDKHPGYCESVLMPAIMDDTGPTATPPTMPPGSIATTSTNQTDWLFEACKKSPGQGQVVRFEPPSIDVFPPNVTPPYACTQHVTVTDFIPGATLRLFRAGSPSHELLAEEIATEQTHTFEVGQKFEVDEELFVTQSHGTQTVSSSFVRVRDHREDYPNGELPAPTIAPNPVYECARSIAVRHIPGATLMVRKMSQNDASLVKTVAMGTAHSRVDMGAAGAFVVGDEFVAAQSICEDESDPSQVETAEAAPSSLPVELVRPIVGQHILKFRAVVQGSRLWMDALPSTYLFDDPSFPFRRGYFDLTNSPIGVVSGSTSLLTGQRLCKTSTDSSHAVTPLACDADTLEDFVPDVVEPHPGDDFIIVLDAVPGALVRVFDHMLQELGNGADSLIQLSRPVVAGETILVAQQLVPIGGGQGCAPSWAMAMVVN